MAGPPQPPQPAGHRQAVPGNRWERLPPVPALARLTLSPVPESGGGGCLRGHAANGPDCPVPLSGRGPCQAAAGAERDCSGSHRQGPAALSGIVLLQLPRNALCCAFQTRAATGEALWLCGEARVTASASSGNAALDFAPDDNSFPNQMEAQREKHQVENQGKSPPTRFPSSSRPLRSLMGFVELDHSCGKMPVANHKVW
ncbi:uncharacterized protein LOC135290727 isoform X2 [Passer domesticus]|uniref:uncharacterized protein LOC135290727 isoform X2 n=1 Tax=Passer domesticus TaxID=48849 RepID=UPI0030FE2B9A